MRSNRFEEKGYDEDITEDEDFTEDEDIIELLDSAELLGGSPELDAGTTAEDCGSVPLDVGTEEDNESLSPDGEDNGSSPPDGEE